MFGTPARGRIFSIEDAKPTTRPFAAARFGLDLCADRLKLGADSHLALQALEIWRRGHCAGRPV